ncbi:Conserved hypothetical protein [Seminavis robusta]|uniref:DUF1749-domain-containing protein n=1 Tax=Seminavis robusta TaxID=568900 RepID=A0A9N8DQH3_9STRA|nr:Conserved hypothetical protein [Seminavis robusta]|eukprot:Sro299_g111350.1 Conserved hypothetical protein (312) ;mRNA; r:33408-34605
MVVPSSGGAPPVPPISPYGTLQGSLFCYDANKAAFESVPSGSSEPLPSKKCILVGGLSDGLMPTPYTQDLEKECHKLGWSFVMPILSSSYLGFGNGDLERDSQEISALMWYLTCHRSAETFALVGHSTGCQNAVHFSKHGQADMVQKTKVIALQAPVSDREEAVWETSKYDTYLEIANKLKEEGKELEMMPRAAFWAPITAQRYLGLHAKGGADDFFSSDWTDEELVDRLGHMSNVSDRKVLVAFSGADEYVPKQLDCKRMSERLCKAINGGKEEGVSVECFLPNANHNLSEAEGDKEKFAQKVAEYLRNL